MNRKVSITRLSHHDVEQITPRMQRVNGRCRERMENTWYIEYCNLVCRRVDEQNTNHSETKRYANIRRACRKEIDKTKRKARMRSICGKVAHQ